MTPNRPNKVSVILLAAGLGKRMHSSLPKVLVPVCGRPMIFHILDRVSEALPGARVAIVVGHKKEEVIAAVTVARYESLKIEFVTQVEQKGTGDAVRAAMDSAWGKVAVAEKENVLVLPGDLPLITGELISDSVLALPRGSALRLVTAEMEDPFGYGRIVRKGKRGSVLRIVEEKDANQREKLIKEVGLSIYLFNAGFLSVGVKALKNNNAQKEFYLTDLIHQAAQKKRPIETLVWGQPSDVRGINNPYELSLVCDCLNERMIKAHAMNGVRFMNMRSVRVESTVKISPNVLIYPGVILEGNTQIASGVVIGPHVSLKNVMVGEDAEIKKGSIAEDSSIGAGSKVGPYAHLRPGSEVGASSKIGNFVELKKSKIGAHTSIAHLSYVGDAVVGDRVNIGCGFVTCNFDGRVIDGKRKHETVIEDDVFVGSDCQTVAPIKLGKGSYVASGSTITADVPAGDLAIARSRQVNKTGYAARIKLPSD